MIWLSRCQYATIWSNRTQQKNTNSYFLNRIRLLMNNFRRTPLKLWQITISCSVLGIFLIRKMSALLWYYHEFFSIKSWSFKIKNNKRKAFGIVGLDQRRLINSTILNSKNKRKIKIQKQREKWLKIFRLVIIRAYKVGRKWKSRSSQHRICLKNLNSILG